MTCRAVEFFRRLGVGHPPAILVGQLLGEGWCLGFHGCPPPRPLGSVRSTMSVPSDPSKETL
nr:MAG TPA: hypothetical protein [Caudoviricetes sp.]